MSWKLSITMEVIFCLEMLEEAIAKYGIPIIINTDQGAQYTSLAWVSALQAMAIQISMDGRGVRVQIDVRIFRERGRARH